MIKSSAKNSGKTELYVKFDCGFSNALFIRGSGPKGLTWAKGLPLKNIAADEWLFVCETPSSTCEFKILLNDEIYEYGENHILLPEQKNYLTPQF